MPYFVQPVVVPPVAFLPNGAPSPQLQQFVTQLTQDLNNIEQRGMHLDQMLPAGPVTLLIFKQ
jgi:hypothetical protein